MASEVEDEAATPLLANGAADVRRRVRRRAASCRLIFVFSFLGFGCFYEP
jgi:hypothetical protein